MDNVEVTAEQIQTLLDKGNSKTEIGQEFGISAQKVGMILAAANDKSTDKKVREEIPASAFAKEYSQSDLLDGNDNSKVVIMTAGEYKEYSEANGRHWGRKEGKKTKCSIEELRALINSGWKPSMIIDKHGINADEFKQLVWALSQRELRDKPLKYSLEQDFIEK